MDIKAYADAAVAGVPLDVLRGVIEYVKALEAIKDKTHPRPAGY